MSKVFVVKWSTDESGFADAEDRARTVDAAQAIRVILETSGFNRARIFGNGVIQLTGPGVPTVEQSSADAEQGRPGTVVNTAPAGESAPRYSEEEIGDAGEAPLAEPTNPPNVTDEDTLESVIIRVEKMETQLAELVGVTSPTGSLGRRVLTNENTLEGAAKVLKSHADHITKLQSESKDALTCYTAMVKRQDELNRLFNWMLRGLIKAGIVKESSPLDAFRNLAKTMAQIFGGPRGGFPFGDDEPANTASKGRDALKGFVPGTDKAVDLWKRVWRFRDTVNLEAPDELDEMTVGHSLKEWLDVLDRWVVELSDNGGDEDTIKFVGELVRDIRSAAEGFKMGPVLSMWGLLDRLNATGQAENYWSNRTLGDRIKYSIDHIEECDLDEDDTVARWITDSPFASEIVAALPRVRLSKKVKMAKLLRHLKGQTMGNDSLAYRLGDWIDADEDDRANASIRRLNRRHDTPDFVKADMNTALQRCGLDADATLQELVDAIS